jgi:hypothetical protein
MIVCSADNVSPHMVTFLCKVLPAVKEQVISMCIQYGGMDMIITPREGFHSKSLHFLLCMSVLCFRFI